MLRHGGLGESEVLNEIDDAMLAYSEVSQDRESRRVAKPAEQAGRGSQRRTLVDRP